MPNSPKSSRKSERNKEILEEFFKGKKFSEIGKKLGLSRERIRQIVKDQGLTGSTFRIVKYNRCKECSKVVRGVYCSEACRSIGFSKSTRGKPKCIGCESTTELRKAGKIKNKFAPDLQRYACKDCLDKKYLKYGKHKRNKN
jgi:hypothetical protein